MKITAMKTRLIAAAALALMGTAASAQTADELRIYVNPGHGSWTGNDRPMQPIGHEPYTSTGTDTTSFFESNTDLYKGFGVLEKLIEMGFYFDRTKNQTGQRWEIGAARDLDQNVVMSRVKNGPFFPTNITDDRPDWVYYNRNLSEICVEVEENDFDQFISIHSNAASSANHNNVNYHLYMYRGRNGRENAAVTGSYEMSEAANKYAFANAHASWSEDKPYINGDVDFMGKGSGSTSSLGYYGWLGVLKHGSPGYLVEGFFHTYTPSLHRAMNFDVDIIEGYQYARGVAEYFGLEQRDTTGEIYGIVRDAHQSFLNQLWIARPGSDDTLMPVNGCKVYLWKGGEKIAEYTTDNYYNGAFVFFGLEAGDYQVTFEHPGYDSGDPVDVTVTAGLTSYPKIYLTDAYYNGRPGEEMNYANPLPDTYSLAQSYELAEGYTDMEIPGLAGSTVKRLIYCKGRAYILAFNADGKPEIIVADAHTGYVLRRLQPEAAQAAPGAIVDFSDIQLTGAGVLVACGKSKNQHSDNDVQSGDVRGAVPFYFWDNDADGLPTGEPRHWFDATTACWHRRAYVGDTFTFRGNLDDGEIIMSGVSVATNAKIQNASIEIIDGMPKADSENPGEWAYVACRPTKLAAKDFTDADFVYVLSPNNRHQFFAVGSSATFGIREYSFQHELDKETSGQSPQSVGTSTVGAGFFKYGNDIGMTLATADGLKLYNVSRGITTPTSISLTGAPASYEGRVHTAAYPVAETDAEGNVTSGDFNILVLAGGRLSRYASSPRAGIESPAADTRQAPCYYDLCGRPVAAPAAPGIYIRRQGSTATKVIIK